jgi:HPt (histidine-containing phosphotransfer) domain-containing protein
MNASQDQLFNPELLQKWQEIDKDNWSVIVLDIMSVFFDSTPADYEKLKTAIEKKDRKNTELYSHSLKSSHGNVGAVKMQEAFAKIELASHTANWDILSRYIQDVDNLKAQTYPLLLEYKTSLLVPG